MQTLCQDLRYAARLLRQQPGFTLVAILSLGLGIGANSALFGMMDALLLRPLPFANMDRLVAVWGTVPQEREDGRHAIGWADYLEYATDAQTFEQLAGYQITAANLTGTGEPERLRTARVTTNLFAALGVKPLHGRTFTAEESQLGREAVVVLSYGLWQRRFAADPQIVGQTITLDQRSYTVVGVLADGDEWPLQTDLQMPLALLPELRTEGTRNWVLVTGLLKPGRTQQEALAELEQLTARQAAQYPHTNAGLGVRLTRLPGHAADQYMRPLLALVALAAMFVLLIACANVANLLLARATGRQKEIAIRAALGASRRRIMQQLLVESLLLSSLGALLGVWMAPWLMDFAKASIPPDLRPFLPGLRVASLDWRLLGYTLGLSWLAGIVAGLAPALTASKPDLQHTLKDGGRNGAAPARHRLRGALVVAEVALALLLLVGTGMMVNSFARLTSEYQQGFDATQLLTMKLSLSKEKYRTPTQQIEFFQKAVAQLSAQPGVQSVAVVNNLPASSDWDVERFEIEGRPAPTPADQLRAECVIISPDYHQTLRIPLRQGRLIGAQDTAQAQPVVLLSEAAARRFFPQQNPLGQRLRLDLGNGEWPWHTIVGIVGDVRQFVFDREPRATVYVPHAQMTRTWGDWMTLALRTQGEPLKFVPAVRETLHTLDREQPLFRVMTMHQLLAEHLAPIRLATQWMAGFGLMALVLAAIGVYSVMAYAVAGRTREIGIRRALGAQTAEVLRLVIGHGMQLVGLGIAVGLLSAFAFSRLSGKLMVQASTTEPGLLLMATFVLTMVALLACWVPARRATKVDPMIALRNE